MLVTALIVVVVARLLGAILAATVFMMVIATLTLPPCPQLLSLTRVIARVTLRFALPLISGLIRTLTALCARVIGWLVTVMMLVLTIIAMTIITTLQTATAVAMIITSGTVAILRIRMIVRVVLISITW